MSGSPGGGAQAPRIRTRLRAFFAVVELRTKVVSLSSFCLALLAAAADGRRLAPIRAFLMGAAALAVDMGTTAFNSYFDWYRGTDDARFNREDDKVLVHDGVAPAFALLSAAALFAVAAVLGVVLAAFEGIWIVPVGALCLAAGFLYSGGPRPISSTPIGEPVAGGLLGSALLIIAYYASSLPALDPAAAAVAAGLAPSPSAVAGAFGSGPAGAVPAALWLALPQGLAVAAILAANNACDVEGDRAAGRRTLAVLLGRRLAPVPLYLYVAAGFVSDAAIWTAAVVPAALAQEFAEPRRVPLAAGIVSAAVLAAAAWYAARNLIAAARRGYGHATKGATMGTITRIFVVHSLAAATVPMLILALG